MRGIRTGLLSLGLVLLLVATGCQAMEGEAPTVSPTAAPVPPSPTAPARPTATAAPPPTATAPSPPTATPSAPAKPLGAAPANLDRVQLSVERFAQGFQTPTHITHAGDGSGRLFVVEKAGRVRLIKDQAVLEVPFLDIRELVGSRGSEQGLFSVAFHPRYTTNGWFYVNYTDLQGDSVIARYEVSGDNPDVANPDSASVVLTLDQPYANHNGGGLLFGPDGYLWIGTGDGGSGGDPQGNAQNRQALLGKMLRIDIDGGEPYGIPADNPFVNDQQARDEIWAIGLRNPWRYSFDRQTNDLYIADVGQNQYEEVHFTPAGHGGGLNYGWNIMEGRHCFRPSEGCDRTGLDIPVAEYEHDKGCSITGGYVYRGQGHPELQGIYFFGDYCSGIIWGVARQPDGQWAMRELVDSGLRISSFGEDEAGEVYITAMNNGEIYRLAQGAGG